jgi:serine/threonine-protein kinase ATR
MLCSWESGHFHHGQYQDECFKTLSRPDQITRFASFLMVWSVPKGCPSRGIRMNLYTVRCFAKAIRFGSKYIYQTVPRLLTIWLDLGEDKRTAGTDLFKKLNDVVAKAIKEAPVYKVKLFFTTSIGSSSVFISGSRRSPKLCLVWATRMQRFINIWKI